MMKLRELLNGLDILETNAELDSDIREDGFLGLGQDHGADVGIAAGQQQLPVLPGGQQAQFQGQPAVRATQKEGLGFLHPQSMLQMACKGKPKAGIRLTQSPVKG